MRSNTLVSAAGLLASLVPAVVLAQDYYTTPSPTITSEYPPTGCPIFSMAAPACSPLPADCVTLACLQIQTISIPCGCPVPAQPLCSTYCPTGCPISFATATGSCSSTKNYTASTTTSNKPPPYQTPSTTPPSYANTTKTTTETTIITLTTCPASVTCTGQTTVYTSTAPCPTTTCTCLLPIVKFSTTIIAGQTQSTTAPPATSEGGSSPTTSAKPSPSIIAANVAAATWAGSFGTAGAGVFGFLVVLVWGMV